MKNDVSGAISAAPKKDRYERESGVEANLVKYIKLLGGTAYKFTSPQRRNVPDRLCLLPAGVMCFVECKAPGKKPTPGQQREHDYLRALGFKVFVIDSKDLTELNDWIKSFYRPNARRAGKTTAMLAIIDELHRKNEAKKCKG